MEKIVKNHEIRVRVSKTQLSQIKIIARAKGFMSISAFIRSIALGNGLVLEQKIDKIYKTVVQNEKELNFTECKKIEIVF